MTHEHELDSHREKENSQRRLIYALVIVLVILVAEVIGGIFSGSLSLLGDAGHMLVDALAIGFSLFAMALARRPATATKTFGYHRAEILAALANGTILILVAVYIFYEAYQRILEPTAVKTPLMLTIAIIGLCANLGGIILLNKASQRSLNIKAAFWHIIGDTVSSVGVIIAGVIISLTGLYIVDAIIAVIIGFIILWGAFRIMKEASDILLEAVPKNIDITRVIDIITGVSGVNEVHDIHIWTITTNMHALSAHIVIDDQMVSKSVEIVKAVRHELSRRFNISHTTLQIECESCPTGLVCELTGEDSSTDDTV